MGAGALGSRLLDILACQGYYPTIVDCDKVERHNLGNQNFSPSDIGKLKAVQAANNVYRRLGVSVQSIAKKVTEDNVDKIVSDKHLVVDMFDNIESRTLVKQACKRLNVPCLHCAMSHDGFSEVEWSDFYPIEKFTSVERDDEPCEYPLAVNLVLFTVSFASEVINEFVDNGIKKSVQFTLRDMHTDVLKRS